MSQYQFAVLLTNKNKQNSVIIPFKDGDDCFDIDECLSGEHACDIFANCTNSIGDYNCTCDDGFYGDGFTCVDSDECAELTDEAGEGMIFILITSESEWR